MQSTSKKASPLLIARSIVVRFEPADVTALPKQVARYLGGSQYKMDAQISELITAAIDRGRHLIEPQMVYALHTVSEIIGNDKMNLSHGLSVRVSPGGVDSHAKYLSAAICTLGPDLEKICCQLRGENKLLEAAILDATGVAMIEVLSDKAYKILNELAGKYRLYLGCRFGPGIGDMNLSSQSALFILVKGDKIKVRLNNSMVMIPNKSISFFVEFSSDKNARRNLYKCQTCHRKDCQFKINPATD
jgi:hypothetical protein